MNEVVKLPASVRVVGNFWGVVGYGGHVIHMDERE